MATEPFALLGVNSDADRETLKRVVEENGITWRSWFDGGMEGPIAKHWQIATWPTIYILDAKGIIRHIDTGANVDIQAIEATVEMLLKELKAGQSK